MGFEVFSVCISKANLCFDEDGEHLAVEMGASPSLSPGAVAEQVNQLPHQHRAGDAALTQQDGVLLVHIFSDI